MVSRLCWFPASIAVIVRAVLFQCYERENSAPALRRRTRHRSRVWWDQSLLRDHRAGAQTTPELRKQARRMLCAANRLAIANCLDHSVVLVLGVSDSVSRELGIV